MDNNQDDLNRLINELAIQKQKDRKHQLRIEIAKATDRGVKRALQDILDDIEKKERRNCLIGIGLFLVAVLIGFYVIGIQANKKDNNLPIAKTANSSSSFEENSSREPEPVKEKNLTEEEVKQWVSAVIDKRDQDIPNKIGYELELSTNDKDKLLYIGVEPPKGVEIDSLDSFRINANGELEESGYFVKNADINEWVVVSRKFMDVSEVKIKDVPTQLSSSEKPKVRPELTAEEFAELYAKWSNSDYPIMNLKEFEKEQEDIESYDDSSYYIVYSERDDNTAQFMVQRAFTIEKSFYTYKRNEGRAYLNSNNSNESQGSVQYQEDLTNFINQNK